MAQIKSAKLDSKTQEVTVVFGLGKPSASKSGKTLMVFTTGGFQALDGIMVDGKTVKISINATIPQG